MNEILSKLSPVRHRWDPKGVIHWEDFVTECEPRLAFASIQDCPRAFASPAHYGRFAVVGAGPSVKYFVPELRRYLDGFSVIATLNAAHAFCLENDITPSIHTIFEVDLRELEQTLGGPPRPEVVYWVASVVRERIIDDLKSYKRVLWHAELPPERYHHLIAKVFPGEFMVGGAGYTTFFRTLTIGWILGFRDFDIYGCDCSFTDSSHVEGYRLANIEPRVNVWFPDPRTGKMRKFLTQGGLSWQAQEFIRFCSAYPDLRVRVHGDSLLRCMHETAFPKNYQLQGA